MIFYADTFHDFLCLPCTIHDIDFEVSIFQINILREDIHACINSYLSYSTVNKQHSIGIKYHQQIQTLWEKMKHQLTILTNLNKASCSNMPLNI